ncbi:MAG: CCA tRNA nucleotidyltransferase [Deltaproteobacteria bacterium]
MERHLKRLPEDMRSLICRAGDVSRRTGDKAFLVGGFVRDLVLGVRDYDLDIAIEGDGIGFASDFAGTGRLITHKRFGTATVVLDDHKVDFASTRKETYPQPAALPVVSPGLLRDDLFRRDFTINTLAVGLSGGSFGELIDLFGGKEDIGAGIIRVLHDRSFIDDPTRILRAVRFEQRYGFRIEPHTLRLLRGAVKEGMLLRVQPQRLRDELLLMLKEEKPVRALSRLNELAGFDFLSPGIRWRPALFARISETAERFREHCRPRRHLEEWVMYLAALFDGLTVAQAQAVCLRYGLGKSERTRVLEYLRVRKHVTRALSKRVVARSGLFGLLEPLPYEVILLIKAESGPVVGRRIEEFFSDCHGVCVAVSGHDLKQMGIEPGPEYQRIFKRLLEAKLNGRISTKSEEMELIGRMRKKGSP